MFKSSILALSLAAMTPSVVFAQTKPAAPAPVSSVPERTTASFGDWVVRCEGSGAQAQRVCEVAQSVTIRGQQAPIAQVAFGRPARGEPMRLTLVVPVNVSFPSEPEVLAGKGDTMKLTWQRCVPAGCIASATPAADLIGRLSSRTEPGTIQFNDASGRQIAIPLSFHGLSQALAALAKE